MQNRRRIIVGLIIAVFVGGAIYTRTWTTNPTQTVSTVRINIPFPAIDFAPLYVAKSKGWLNDSLASKGVKPEFLPPFQSIPVTFESLATNRVDLVMCSSIPPIINRAGGNDVRIVWLSCTLKSEAIVPANSIVGEIADLKGKKVGTMIGSDSHYWLIRNIEQSGLNRDDVTFINLFPPDAKAAFNTGAIDAWATFPPFSSQELVAGNAKIVSHFDAPIQVVLVSRGGFLREHKDLVDAVSDALEKAKKWIIENPGEAQAIVAQETTLPLAVVQFAWPQLDWTATLDTQMADHMQSNADFLKSEGLIRETINVRTDVLSENPQ